jgi:predicted negative regulator of RcsB-dependent stress response
LDAGLISNRPPLRVTIEFPPEVFVSRITRKELKTDKFALEVEQTVTFFEEHQKDLVKYGAAAAAVVLIIIAIFLYRGHQRSIRQQDLANAIAIQEASIGGNSPGGGLTYPTLQAREAAAVKAFAELATKHSGSQEGIIATNYLGAIAVDQGKLDEAEKRFKEVADSGDSRMASLAKFSLAQVYLVENKNKEAEVQLRDLIDHPSEFVSKEQASFTLARALAKTNPAEARKLLDPLRTSTDSAVSQQAITLYSQLGSQ